MSVSFTASEQWSLRILCAGNDAMLKVFEDVAARQPGSRSFQSRAQESQSGLQTQLPYSAPMFPICVEKASGARITDVDGNEYIDCHMAYTATILGHNPPEVLEPFREAMERGLGAGHFFREHVELAELVRELVPDVERVAYFHTGGEAVSAAVRLARARRGEKKKVAKFEGCYHGSNDIGLHNTMMALSGVAPQGTADDIAPSVATAGLLARDADEILVLPFNDSVALDRIREHAGELACVVVDPAPPFMSPWPDTCRSFLASLRELTAEMEVPLIFDEVVAGFRLARGGAREWSQQRPEMSCFGKITSGLGLPLSMIAGDARLLDLARTDGLFRDYPARKAWLSSTLGGNFPAVAAALAQMRYLSDHYDELMNRLDRNAEDLKHRLDDFAQNSGIDIGLQGNPRLQMQLSIGKSEPAERTYRGVMASTSLAGFRALMALTFYLRQRGVYMKMIPTMNLSAAHTPEDIEGIAAAVGDSLQQMEKDGALDS